jgi:hypothetical protein
MVRKETIHGGSAFSAHHLVALTTLPKCPAPLPDNAALFEARGLQDGHRSVAACLRLLTPFIIRVCPAVAMQSFGVLRPLAVGLPVSSSFTIPFLAPEAASSVYMR